MKIVKLLAALTVLSILVAPAIAMHTIEGCTCTSGGCESSHAKDSHVKNCCGKCSDESYSHRYTCNCRISPFSNFDASDPDYSYLDQSRSRPYGRESGSVSPSSFRSSGDGSDGGAYGSSYAGEPGIASGAVGPPDFDVIEYLPPSAKLVFDILASNGPLTQKDLISRTDLPPRTVRYALGRLKEESIIRECFYFPDARQSLYGLNTAITTSKAQVRQI